ncbi:DUF6992 family protein [Pirellulaceae bacterium SH449]
MHQQLVATIFALALLSLGSATVALFFKPRDFARGFWLMLGLWGLLDGLIVWPSLLQEPMAPEQLHIVLGINLLLQLIYLPTGILLLTRTKALVKGFGWGVLASAIPLAIIDAVFYLRLSSQ